MNEHGRPGMTRGPPAAASLQTSYDSARRTPAHETDLKPNEDSSNVGSSAWSRRLGWWVVFWILVCLAMMAAVSWSGGSMQWAKWLATLAGDSDKTTVWTKVVVFFVLEVLIMSLLIPLILPMMILCGFMLGKTHFALAILTNYAAYLCAAAAVSTVATRFSEKIRGQLQAKIPKLLALLKLLESDRKLVFLFRFALFPITGKNIIGGLLHPSTRPTFVASCVVHGIYISALFAYLGSLGFDLAAGGASSGRQEWNVYGGVVAMFTVVFFGGLMYAYRSETRQMRAILGEIGGH